jgi:hypothetical protein
LPKKLLFGLRNNLPRTLLLGLQYPVPKTLVFGLVNYSIPRDNSVLLKLENCTKETSLWSWRQTGTNKQ